MKRNNLGWKRNAIIFGVVVAAATIASLPALAKTAPSDQPYTVGVLPFSDDTGSGGADLANALAHAVQTQLAHSTGLEGRVVTIGNGANPSSIDGSAAVQLGRSQNVDAVLIGTVVQASSEKSEKSVGGISIGGLSLGGNVHSVKATVTLQGDLYDVSSGSEIDSIRVTKEVSKSHVGGDVNTSLADLSSDGNAFYDSPIGHAFHQAVVALSDRISRDRPKMTHYAAATSIAAGGAVPSGSEEGKAAGSTRSTVGTAAQPNLLAVKIDFIPGDKTIFYDDFSDMPPGEPPPHWQVRGGTVSLAMGGGIRELQVSKDVTLTSATLRVPEDFTFQMKFTEHVAGTTDVYFKDKDDNDSLDLDIDPASTGGVSISDPGGELGSGKIKDGECRNPCEVDVWAQGGRVRLYFNGRRLVDVNQVKYSPITHLVLHRSWTTLGLRSIRIAESAPDPGLVLATTGKYVTHGIYFDTGSAILKPQSAPVIKEISNALYKNPSMKLEIIGYTDSTGSAKHNLELSQQRADAVRSVLVSQFGIDASRLSSKGLGAANPIASNDTASGRAQNRRVEFVKKP